VRQASRTGSGRIFVKAASSLDSPLERNGFEHLVPRQTRNGFEAVFETSDGTIIDRYLKHRSAG
jgi:hypothetical protein